MSNLRLLNVTTVTTPANIIQVNDVFTDDFDIYCIQINNTTCASSTENNSMDFRLINSSGSTVAANYDNFMTFARNFSDTYLQTGGTSRDELAFFYHATSSQNGNGNMTMWLFNPFSSSSFTFQVQQSSGQTTFPGTTQIPYFQKGIGVLRELSSITGYSITNRDSFNISTGTLKTFGLRVDN